MRLPALLAFFAIASVSWLSAAADDAASRLIVVVNSNDPDSLRIARHYAAARAVPGENIIALPLSTAETITWREFVTTLWQPLQDELVARGWIEAIRMNLTDDAGRTKSAISGHRISYLVTCRGVPLRINHDPLLAAEAKPLTDQPQFRTNRGAVDSELSLLTHGNYNLNAFMRNPLFLNERPSTFDLAQIVKVSRLDGPTPADVLAMIDRTLEAEQRGLLGRAYVDLRGPHAQGNRWFEAVAKQLEELNFDLEVNRASGTFPATARFDAPVLYFGWYATNLNGPFALPNFRLPPGAIALHIHSYSAHTMRSPTSGWAGPLVARGASVTFGAVFEPYLELMHQPQLLLRLLAQGWTLGDAAYFSVPALSWQNVVIGDPLYRPFAVNAAQQWAAQESLPDSLRPYATLREITRLRNAEQVTEAIALARTAMKDQPSLALGLALARMLQDNGDLTGAADALGFARYLRVTRSDDWALWQQAAALLETCGAPDPAVAIYRGLLATAELPDELKQAWLTEGVRVARAARNLTQASDWEREAAALTLRSSGTQ